MDEKEEEIVLSHYKRWESESERERDRDISINFYSFVHLVEVFFMNLVNKTQWELASAQDIFILSLYIYEDESI